MVSISAIETTFRFEMVPSVSAGPLAETRQTMTTKKAARTGKNRIRGGGATAQRAKPAVKKTERRSGDKSTRAGGGQQKRQAPLSAPPQRGSGLEGRPKRAKQMVDAERKGQNPKRKSASRKKAR